MAHRASNTLSKSCPAPHASCKGCIVPSVTTVVDFGSWIGPTVLWASVLGAKHVYSFEPDPFAYAELSTNLKISGVANVSVHNACISPDGGSTQLFFRGGNSISSTYNIIKDGKGNTGMGYSRTIEVPCWRLEDVMRHYDMQGPLFIKVRRGGGLPARARTVGVQLLVCPPQRICLRSVALRATTRTHWEVVQPTGHYCHTSHQTTTG